MGKVVNYEPCPECRKNGKDSRGDNLVRYSDDGAYCFACYYKEPPRIRALLGELLNKEKENVPKNKVLPASFTREVPQRAWQWLFKFGLGYSYWKDKVGFAPEENRLVFLVGNPVAFSIGRYISPTLFGEPEGRIQMGQGSEDGTVVSSEGRPPRKWYAYGEPHKHCEVLSPDSGPGETVVLVEDIISAHKVARITNCIPLFGTQIHKSHMYYLMNQDKPIRIWLDKDQEHNVHKITLHLQSMVNVPVSVIITEDDPKWQSMQTIKELTL